MRNKIEVNETSLLFIMWVLAIGALAFMILAVIP